MVASRCHDMNYLEMSIPSFWKSRKIYSIQAAIILVWEKGSSTHQNFQILHSIHMKGSDAKPCKSTSEKNVVTVDAFSLHIGSTDSIIWVKNLPNPIASHAKSFNYQWKSLCVSNKVLCCLEKAWSGHTGFASEPFTWNLTMKSWNSVIQPKNLGIFVADSSPEITTRKLLWIHISFNSFQIYK